MSLPPILAWCDHRSVWQVHGLSLNWPVIGLAALFTAGWMLVAVGRGHKPSVKLSWLRVAVLLDIAGMALAWMVALWFVPLTIGAA